MKKAKRPLALLLSAAMLLSIPMFSTSAADLSQVNPGAAATAEAIASSMVQSVNLDKTELTLYTEKTATISATVSPDDVENKRVHFTSTTPAVTVVSESYDEETGVSTATLMGTEAAEGTIIAISENGYKTATCTVNVQKSVGENEFVIRSLEGGIITSNAVNPPAKEQPEMAFDNKRDTKFLSFSTSVWLHFQFKDGHRYPINQYAIVSGQNDHGRDPKDWDLLASNDGEHWVTLDSRRDETFEGDKLRRLFQFDNTEAYEYYRLDILSNNGDVTTQLTEFQLYECGAYPSWALGPFEKVDEYNPVLTPDDEPVFHDPVTDSEVHWQEGHLYNPGAVVKDGVINVLFRAQDNPLVSRIGLATSTDGVTFERYDSPILYPDNDFMYDIPGGGEDGGCEDPRVVKREDGTYVMTYSSYSRSKGKCTLSVATSTDLINWTKHGPALVDYEENYQDLWTKSGSIVCDLVGEEMIARKIDGKYWMYFNEHPLYAATSDDLIHWEVVVDGNGNPQPIMTNRAGMYDSRIVEPGPPAIYTEYGILLIYNGANENPNGSGDPMVVHNAYLPGMALFDPDDPTKLITRTASAFMYPEKDYELEGLVNNVCFVEGLVYYQGTWYLYYGTADSRLAVATYTPDPVDKTGLDEAIQSVDSLDLSGFTQESVDLLNEQLQTSREVYASAMYNQKQVDEFTEALQQAVRDLEPKPVEVKPVVADKDHYDVNETITLTVTTSLDVRQLALSNENGKGLGMQIPSSSIVGDKKVWTVTACLGTAGASRTITVNGRGSDGIFSPIGQVTISIGDVAPPASGPAEVYSAKILSDTAKVNEDFTVEVKTNLNTTKLSVRNERDRAISFTVDNCVDEGDVRTYTITMQVGSTGFRLFSFLGANSDKEWCDVSVESSITITK